MSDPSKPVPPFDNVSNTEIADNNNANINPTENAGFGNLPFNPYSPNLNNTQNDNGLGWGSNNISVIAPGNFQNSKGTLGSVLPEKAVWTHPYTRVENLLTPQQLRDRFLFGVPLYSSQKDPVTGRRAEITDEMIRDSILPRAVMMAEQGTHTDIFPVQRAERKEFDRVAFQSFGYCLVEHRPVSSIQQFAIAPTGAGVNTWVMPLSWIETGNLIRGQINFIPLTVAYTGGGTGSYVPTDGGGGGAMLLNVMAQRNFIPAYFTVSYVSGYENGVVPIWINELIGNYAAKIILEQLAATNKIPNYSLAVDGISQSVNTSGTTVYAERLRQIDESIDRLVNQVKSMCSVKMLMTNF